MKRNFFIKGITKAVTRLNRFESSVTFTVEKKNECLNFIGGCCFLFILILMLLYGGILFTKLMNKNDIQINQNVVRAHIDQVHDGVIIEEKDEIEFRVDIKQLRGTNSNITGELAASILDFDLKNYQNQEGNVTASELQTSECSEYMSGVSNSTIPLKTFCFKLTGQEVSRRPAFGISSSAIIGSLRLCPDESFWICENPNFIFMSLLMLRVEVFVKSKYVDLNDIENPVKDYVEPIYRTGLHHQYGVALEVLLERHKVILEDSPVMSFSEPEPIEFTRASEISKMIERRQNTINSKIFVATPFQIYVELGAETFQHKRTLFTFLELTGMVGGVFEVFEIFFAIMLGIFYHYYSKRTLASEIRKNMIKLLETEKELEVLKNLKSSPDIPLHKNPVPPLKQTKTSLHLPQIPIKEELKHPSLPISKHSNKPPFQTPTNPQNSLHPSKSLPKISQTPIPLPTPSNLPSPKSILHTFKSQKDCLNILYRIQSLELKVTHLLDQNLSSENPPDPFNISLNNSSSNLIQELDSAYTISKVGTFSEKKKENNQKDIDKGKISPAWRLKGDDKRIDDRKNRAKVYKIIDEEEEYL